MVSEVNCLQQILSRIILKDEIKEIGSFSIGGDVLTHLKKVNQKILDNEIESSKRASFLKKTLSDDVLLELSVMPEYDTKQDNFQFLVDTLKSLYKSKKSEITPYIDLFKIKQQPPETVNEFLSTVRIHGSKILSEFNQVEKEKMLIMCFINGLGNKHYSQILKEIKPTSLKVAFELIKKEKECSDDWKVNVISKQQHCGNNCQSQFKALQSKVIFLEKQITQLISLSSSRPRVSDGFTAQTRRNIQCYNCQGLGHIARNCRRRTLCKHCGLPGHINENCRKKVPNGQRQFIRHVEPIQAEQQSNIGSLDIELSGRNAVDFINENDEEIFHKEPNIMTINTNGNFKQDKKKAPTYSKVVENWAQYINGEGGKPKSFSKAETVISNSTSETARDKPIVKINIENHDKNILFDTGCDCNVIDFAFFKQLTKSNPTLKIVPKKHNLSCANGTKLAVVGYSLLNLLFGNTKATVKFTIVDKIVPNVIIGMNTMKRYNISVSPGQKNISVDNCEFLPFVSQKSRAVNF